NRRDRAGRLSRMPVASRASVVFFFQAEDGIRDLIVTGVQTCALPISSTMRPSSATTETPSTSRFVIFKATLFSSSSQTGSGGNPDRKSTRLNSSHDQISYAVFCLKKKKKKQKKNTTKHKNKAQHIIAQ